MVSSLDPDKPAEHAIDGQDGTFWLSTGLYPQDLIAELAQPGTLAMVRLVSAHVKRLRIEGCPQGPPRDFTVLAERDLEETSGCLQVQEIPCCLPSGGSGSSSARGPRGGARAQLLRLQYVRLVVESGWRDFCAVHRLEARCSVRAPAPPSVPHRPLSPTTPGVVGAASSDRSLSETDRSSRGRPPPGVTRGAPSAGGARAAAPAAGDGPQPCGPQPPGSSQEEGAVSEQGRRLWLERVSQDGWRLAEAPEVVRADREVVLAAVAQYGQALEHASEWLRGDVEVVTTALNQDPWAGQFMAEVLGSAREAP